MRALIVAAAAVCFLGSPGHAETIKIATWNIEHLRADTGVGPVKLDEEDFDALASPRDLRR